MSDLHELLASELEIALSDEEGSSKPEFVARRALLQLVFVDGQADCMGAMLAFMLESNPGHLFGKPLLDEWVASADTDEMARKSVASAIVLLSESKTPLPMELAHLARDFILGERIASRPRGRPPGTERDKAIAHAVTEILRSFPDLRPTRSPASKHPCACSIVVEELVNLNGKSKVFPVLSEGAVQKIWERHS